jgi:hypothetical protein
MDAKAEKIALFRYGLFAPLVLEPLPRGDSHGAPKRLQPGITTSPARSALQFA